MSRNTNVGSQRPALLVIVMMLLALAPGVWAQDSYKSLYSFTLGDDGGIPTGGLIFDSAGNLYGTTAQGGGGRSVCGGGCGVVFELSPNLDGSWTESVLYSFGGMKDGAAPASGLIFDQAGNLYGTTQSGGPANVGVVFKLTPNSNGTWAQTVLYGFCPRNKFCRDGRIPSAGLVFDGAGNLYGTTLEGGSPSCIEFGCGVVFELTPNSDGSWKENVIHYFYGENEAKPQASLIFDAAGNLYSTTDGAGKANQGTVFELTPNGDGTWKHKLLHSFTGGKAGGYPLSALIFDQTGNLYGTTIGGGDSGCGSIGCGVAYRLAPNSDGTWREKVLHHFTGGQDGGQPAAGLIFDQAGDLYGTATYGGNLSQCIINGQPDGCGVAFKLVPNSNGGWSETVLHRFVDHVGDAHPDASVIFDGHGNLYGTTAGDLVTTFGSVFEITP